MMNGISLAVTSPRFRAGASGPVDPDRYMFFATRNRMPSGTIVTAASGTNYVCSKIIVSTPQYKTRTFRFHLSGFASTEGGNSPQETIVTGTIGTPGNSVLIDEMYMRVGGTFHQLQFGCIEHGYDRRPDQRRVDG